GLGLAAGFGQVSALLFLFPGSGVRTGIPAPAHLGSFPRAILRQRPQLAGIATQSENIAYRLLDNALVEVADWQRAQQISDKLRVDQLHRQLDDWAQRYCPF